MTITTQPSGGAGGHILRRWTTDEGLLVGAQNRSRPDAAYSRVQPSLSLLAWKLNSMRGRPLNRETR